MAGATQSLNWKLPSSPFVVHTINPPSAQASSPSLRSLPFLFGLSFLIPEVKDHFLHFSLHKLRTWAEDISALKFQVVWESTHNKLYNKKCCFMSLKVFTCLWYKLWIVASLGHILQNKYMDFSFSGET